MKSATLMLVLLPWLAACASAPSAPLPVPCPQPPALDRPAPDVLAPSFLDRMQNFLQGKLPAPTSSGSPSASASSSTSP